MHIIIGFLGSLVTILYLLDRLGIDIGGLNPFYWYRRRAFAKKFGADPIYSIEDPVHLASLFVIGAAKLDGELTAEQRRAAQRQFEAAFSLTEADASALFGSASHLLAAPQLLDDQLGKLADKNKSSFSKEQAESLLDMMVTVVTADGEASRAQREFIEKVRGVFVQPQREGTW